MSPTRKPPSPLLIRSSDLALSALMAATVFSSMALASAAVPCANAVVENKTAVAPSAPITNLRNMDIPPCSSSNLQLSCTVRRPDVFIRAARPTGLVLQHQHEQNSAHGQC